MNRTVIRWLARHHALITRRRAGQLGLKPHQVDWLVRSGRWRRIHSGVYHLAGAPFDDRTALVAALAGADNERAAVSHLSAAWLHGLLPRAPAQPTITIPRSCRPKLTGVRVSYTRRPVTRVRVQGLPCTDILRTIVDCAAEVTPAQLDAIIDTAVARKLITLDRLAGAVDGPELRHHRGRLQLRGRLRERGIVNPPHPSVLESRTARLIVRAGLPLPRAEFQPFADGRYRLDFAYELIKLAIEVDGWAHHSSPESFRRDHRRRNELTANGWTVLHYTWRDVVHEPERVATEIRAAYHRLAAA